MYITDKLNDIIINKLIKLIIIKIRVVKYEDALKDLRDLMRIKIVYKQVIEKV
jgi:hypothetical protein